MRTSTTTATNATDPTPPPAIRLVTRLATATTITEEEGVVEGMVEEGMTVEAIARDMAVVVVGWCKGTGLLVPSCTTTTTPPPHCSCATCLRM